MSERRRATCPIRCFNRACQGRLIGNSFLITAVASPLFLSPSLPVFLSSHVRTFIPSPPPPFMYVPQFPFLSLLLSLFLSLSPCLFTRTYPFCLCLTAFFLCYPVSSFFPSFVLFVVCLCDCLYICHCFLLSSWLFPCLSVCMSLFLFFFFFCSSVPHAFSSSLIVCVFSFPLFFFPSFLPSSFCLLPSHLSISISLLFFRFSS